VALLAAIGVIGGFAQFLALGASQAGGRSAAAVEAAQGQIRLGAVLSGTALVVVAGLAIAAKKQRLPARALALSIPLVVGADLWRNSLPFWDYSPIQEELLGGDPITDYLSSDPQPYRVLQIPGAEVYPGNTLMGYAVPQLLGYHGNELHRFDELLGGKNQWRNLGALNLWDLFGVGYLIVPSGVDFVENEPRLAALFEKIMSDVRSSAGAPADLYTSVAPPKLARLVPGALKAADEEALATVVDPRFDPDRLVLLDPQAGVSPASLNEMPEPLADSVILEDWRPGRVALRVSPPVTQDAYLVVAENWYPDWKATVDGTPAEVMRGNVSLLTVPVPAGASEVELLFSSTGYRTGRLITWIALVITVLALLLPPVLRKRAAVA
jgi:hypothetical protein